MIWIENKVAKIRKSAILDLEKMPVKALRLKFILRPGIISLCQPGALVFPSDFGLKRGAAGARTGGPASSFAPEQRGLLFHLKGFK
ncbi:MAG: hypothetical protein ABI477_07565 [Chryseolinea sp.]